VSPLLPNVNSNSPSRAALLHHSNITRYHWMAARANSAGSGVSLRREMKNQSRRESPSDLAHHKCRFLPARQRAGDTRFEMKSRRTTTRRFPVAKCSAGPALAHPAFPQKRRSTLIATHISASTFSRDTCASITRQR